jgi:hypothetical protein
MHFSHLFFHVIRLFRGLECPQRHIQPLELFHYLKAKANKTTCPLEMQSRLKIESN